MSNAKCRMCVWGVCFWPTFSFFLFCFFLSGHCFSIFSMTTKKKKKKERKREKQNKNWPSGIRKCGKSESTCFQVAHGYVRQPFLSFFFSWPNNYILIFLTISKTNCNTSLEVWHLLFEGGELRQSERGYMRLFSQETNFTQGWGYELSKIYDFLLETASARMPPTASYRSGSVRIQLPPTEDWEGFLQNIWIKNVMWCVVEQL